VIGTLHMAQPGPVHTGSVRLVAWVYVWGLAQLVQDTPLGQAEEERGGTSFPWSLAPAMREACPHGDFFSSPRASAEMAGTG
jgi:hypothetical protein